MTIDSSEPGGRRPPVTNQVAGEAAAAGVHLTDEDVQAELVADAQGRTPPRAELRFPLAPQAGPVAPVHCPGPDRSTDVHLDGVCPHCGRPWPIHQAA